MAKRMIRPIRAEAEHREALEEIERYFESSRRRCHCEFSSADAQDW